MTYLTAPADFLAFLWIVTVCSTVRTLGAVRSPPAEAVLAPRSPSDSAAEPASSAATRPPATTIANRFFILSTSCVGDSTVGGGG